MSYTPTTYVEGVTKLGPTNMNHLETGVQAVGVVADAAIAKPSTPATNAGLVYNGSAWVAALLVNGNIDPAANIVYSKLSLAGSIVNNDIASGAAIAYAKLSLTNTIARTDMALGNKTTVSTMAGGPPGSPSDGDIWIATAVDSNGVRWSFQYNAGSVSTSKWEFLGGPATIVQVATQESRANVAYGALATAGPSITVARAGDYIIEIGADTTNGSASGVAYMSYDIGGTGAVDTDSIRLMNPGNITTNGAAAAVVRKSLKTGIAAATALVSKYRSGGADTASFANRYMAVIPVRVA